MLVLMRRAATWRPLFLQHSCQFCCGGSPQVLPEHGSHGLQQSTSPAESCKLGKELGLILRKTHNKLRSDLRQGREFKEVWSEHSSNITDLSEYAATMVSMAQHWETKDTSLKARNTWIEAQVRCYYNRRSNLAMLQEEMRRARLDLALLTPLQQELLMKLQPTLNAHWKQQMQKDLRDLHAGPEDPKRPDETTNDGQSVKGAATGSENVTHVSSSLPQALVYSDGSCATGQLHAVNRVRVLDVGSCYNPLGRYPHLLVTPIDLMPATQDVYKCDFLDVKVVNASEGCDLPPVEGQDAGVDRKIERLPSNYYDVVVFSLVLDYIPCPEARLRCCRKAHQLLRPGGLLLIVTPSCCSGPYGKRLLKWNQLQLARLGFGLLNKWDNGNYRTFSYRKGFFQSIWSVVEAKKVESELKSLIAIRKIAYNNKDEIDFVDLEKGLYFSMDLRPLD